MSVKTKYPHFRLTEPRVVQADRLIYRKTSPNCQHGIFLGLAVTRDWPSLCYLTETSRKILDVRRPCHFIVSVSVCLCLRAGPNMSVNHSKFVSPGEDPETRRMRTVKNIADLRQNLEETMSSLRGTQISHR